MKYILFFCLLFNLQAQPLPPKITREYVWIAPLNTNNIGGYILKWGTNSLTLTGALTTNVVIPLQQGVNELVLRSTSIPSSTNVSNPITNRTRFLTFSLEQSIDGINWNILSNYSYALSPTFNNELFRSRINWNTN